MLAAKANPFHRDVFGLNAIDYAINHPETLAKFDAFMSRYRPLDKASQQLIIRRTIIRYLEMLLDLVEEVRPSKQELRLYVTVGLGEALRYCTDSDALGLSRICYISARCPAKGYLIYSSSDCSICKSHLSQEGNFRCTICPDVFLCSKCHTGYVKGWKTPKTAPEGFQKLETLDKQLHGAIKVLHPALSIGSEYTELCINFLPPVAKWFAQKKRAYEEWEAIYNAQGEFKHRQRPGQECLKLLAEVQTTYSVPNTKNTENYRTEEETKLADALDKKLEGFTSTFRAGQDFQDFVCEGHEFMKISREEQERLQANGDLNENGQLAKEWLSTMLARFQDSFQSDLDHKEDSGSPDREADSSKAIGEEPPGIAKDRMVNLSESANVKEEPYQGIMKQPLPPVEQSVVSNPVALNTMMDVESRTGEIPALSKEGSLHESPINDPSETSGATSPIPRSLLIAMALVFAIELGDIVVADGGGVEVQEDILGCKNILRTLMASGEVANEHDEGRRPQHEVEDVADNENEIVESSPTTSDLSSDAARIAETAVAQNTDIDPKTGVDPKTDIDSECAKDSRQAERF